MDKIINFRLMAHPINWAIVWVVVVIASFAWREIMMAAGNNCGCTDIPD